MSYSVPIPNTQNLLLSILVGLLSLAIMNWFTRKNKFLVTGKTVIVTGGSQGMGLGIAKKLASKGANVVIVAQNVPKLENATKAISSCASKYQSQRFHYISADLRKSVETDRVVSEVTTWNNNVVADAVFCCAGNSLPGYFVDTSSEVLRAQMDSIYWSGANMAHSIMKAWLSTGEKKESSSDSTSTRHIVFTSSVLAFFPLAGYAPYNPAKAALRGLADTLVQEVNYYNGARLHSSNGSSSPKIKVHIVYPAGIRSPGFEVEEKLKPNLTKILEGVDVPAEPDVVADTTIAGLERGDYMITINWLGHLMKGAAAGMSPRNGWGVVDTFWTFAGGLIFRYVSWEFMEKCFSVGRKDGREIKGVGVSPYK